MTACDPFIPSNRAGLSVAGVRSGAHPSERSWDHWLLALLLSLFFTPTLRLPGGIPMRLDDAVIFGSLCLFAARTLLKMAVPRPDAMSIYLLLLTASVLLCTAIVPADLASDVGAKEYLDALRPFKFAAAYFLVRQREPKQALRTLCEAGGISLVLLGLIAAFQLLCIKPGADNIFTTIFLAFSDLPEAARMLTLRPFATFNTPTDLGYVSTLGFFLALYLCPKAYKGYVIAACLAALLISATRTFLFSLPFLLILNSGITFRSLRAAAGRLGKSLIGAVICGGIMIYVMSIANPIAFGFTQQMLAGIATGDVQDEESIMTRLEHFQLVAYTWEHAPIFGVVTRSRAGAFVDSELILTFHRYGLFGFVTLMAFYPLGLLLARKIKADHLGLSRVCNATVQVTFLYGITQGALINTRVGIVPVLILGIAASWAGKRVDHRSEKHLLGRVLPE